MARIHHVGGLDALRILAALAVFICHLVAYWHLTGLPLKLPELLANGSHGVDVFIVMSGFVLSLPLFASGRGLDTVNFLRRRVTRILPPYYVALGAATAIAVSPIAMWVVTERASAGDVAWHILLLQTWSPAHLATINGSLWSVALEVQLYAVFPVLVLIAGRWGVWPLLGLTAVLSVVLSGVELQGALGTALTDEHNLPVRLVQFVTGMACASVVAAAKVPPRRVLWLLVVMASLVAIGANTAGFRTGQAALWALASGFLVLLTVDHLGAALERTPLERWGLGAYSFYLLHQPIVLVLGHLVRPHVPNDLVALLVGVLVCLPAVGLAAWAMYVVVERPVHIFGRARYPVLKPTGERVAAV